MTARTTLTGAGIALLIAGTSLVGGAGGASAQQGPGQGGQNCANVQNVYPPGQQNRSEGSVTLNPARRGQQAQGNSGCSRFAPGQRVEFGVESAYQRLGEATASAAGQVSVSFEVPSNLENGRHALVFTALSGPATQVRVPFTVVGAPVVAGNSGLPRTGSDQLIPLTITGVALVGIGAGIILTARRRRESLPVGLA